MTQRQRQAMLFIQRFIAERGYGPSGREIGEAVGTKSSGRVRALILALRERGYISFIPNRHRSITVLRPISPLYEVHVFNDATKELEPYAPKHLEAAE